ncbi:DUF2188 domain-containing protein [Paenisporosarcina sp. OV554]|uniref:DUF2188 domain-containing protein n=1 Tax=Paenisporosarcina sp. OV554 TaxID=2135694 RepID=UPI000D3414CC|nr:DUF2188 domain-containing protein [Paenisporosarcina sp. OV554]PUB14642.1 uncharacterized protein DUF2188 [Paenisporosarcina sp. OV554]
MPWNSTDYPDSFNNLDTPVRKKAIEIANALLRDGTEDGRAIEIVTEKAREYVGGDVKQEIYKVLKHSDGWQLQKDSGTNAISVAATKQELLDKAKPYVNEHNGVLKIYQEDGSLQDTMYDYD